MRKTYHSKWKRIFEAFLAGEEERRELVWDPKQYHSVETLYKTARTAALSTRAHVSVEWRQGHIYLVRWPQAVPAGRWIEAAGVSADDPVLVAWSEANGFVLVHRKGPAWVSADGDDVEGVRYVMRLPELP